MCEICSHLKFESYKVLDLPLPRLAKDVFVSLLNLHSPESGKSRSCMRLLFFSIPHSPPGLSTIKTLFKTWLAFSFPTFNQGALKAIQCPRPAKEAYGWWGGLGWHKDALLKTSMTKVTATYGLPIRLLIFLMSDHHHIKYSSNKEHKTHIFDFKALPAL